MTLEDIPSVEGVEYDLEYTIDEAGLAFVCFVIDPLLQTRREGTCNLIDTTSGMRSALKELKTHRQLRLGAVYAKRRSSLDEWGVAMVIEEHGQIREEVFLHALDKVIDAMRARSIREVAVPDLSREIGLSLDAYFHRLSEYFAILPEARVVVFRNP